MFPPYRRIQTTDKDLNLIQDQLARVFNSLAKNALVDGTLLAQVPLVQGKNVISHSLGRAYVSWAHLRPSAANLVYEVASDDPTKYISLISVGPATADIYVF